MTTPETKKISMGLRFAEERERIGMDQATCGEIAGVGRNTISNYERGLRSPDAYLLQQLAERGMDVLYVVTGVRSSGAGLTPQQQTLIDAFNAARPVDRLAVLRVTEALAGYRVRGGPEGLEDDPDLWRKVARGIPTAPGVRGDELMTPAQLLEVIEGAYRIEQAAQAKEQKASVAART